MNKSAYFESVVNKTRSKNKHILKMISDVKTKRSSRLSEGKTIKSIDYELTYFGKKTEMEILLGDKSPVEKVMSVNHEKSSFPNRLYWGDNLGLLRSLCDDPEIFNKVNLVYIDPPFATGSSFETRDAEHAYRDMMSGSVFLEFLRERLIVIRELMASNGSIYIHLDSKMAFPVKVLMDEIFGPQNFRNWITRQKSNRKNSTTKQFGNVSDYILFYTKSDSYIWNRCYEEWNEDQIKREYQYLDENGKRYKKVPVHAPGVRNGETGKAWRGKLPPPGKHWQYAPATLDAMDARGEIYWSPTGNPRRKLFFEKSKGIAAQDIWTDFKDAHNQNIAVTGYPTEKNIDLLKRIVAASSNPGDLVLDCFMGSGTTLMAADEADRKWIGIDASMMAVETTIKRLAHGSEPMGDFVNGKKQKQESLFNAHAGTDFDLYVSRKEMQDCPSVNDIKRWADFFKHSATIHG